MMVNSEGSRSSVASSMPRAMRTISMASRLRSRAERVGVDRLVRQRQHVEERVEMADRGVDVDRLDRIAAPEMHGVERLPEPEEVLEVVPVAGPAAAVAVGDVGRATRPSRRRDGRRRSTRLRAGIARVQREALAAPGRSSTRPGRGRSARGRDLGRDVGARAPSGCARASSCSTSMPISSSTVSEASWIASSSSSETALRRRKRPPRLRLGRPRRGTGARPAPRGRGGAAAPAFRRTGPWRDPLFRRGP